MNHWWTILLAAAAVILPCPPGSPPPKTPTIIQQPGGLVIQTPEVIITPTHVCTPLLGIGWQCSERRP